MRTILDKCVVCGDRKRTEYGKTKWKYPEIHIYNREERWVAELAICPECAKILSVSTFIQQVQNAEDFKRQSV